MKKNISTFVLVLLCAILSNLYSQQYPSGYQIFEKAKNAVAIINVYDENRNLMRIGAGFTYTPDGQIVTTYNLVNGGTYVKIKVNDKEYVPVAIYKIDRRRDVIVYKIDDNGLPFLSVANSDNVKIGDRVFTIGNPLGFERSFSEGIISAKRDFGAGKVYFQFTGPTTEGMEGSPLLNENGDVIGIISSRSYMDKDLNFAIQINSVREILESTEVKNYSVPNFFVYEKPLTNFNLGLSYESMGDHATAIWYYLKSLKDEVTPETYRRLAYCHEQLGNFKTAESYYRKAKELEERR
ncbi:MAG: trypsin-like peptidase domain-containing protein [Ignavibacteria bacterium]|jgi:S1-C subfamily serine protease|nr:trypsin-like peptidase domain-containing protein [Ignavibacteria bacterium]MDH7527730.1 trypsin-like peptidase domain-containing protein [Ignavibacteria bacterium]NPV10968.1 tetratricopeptide repeat protein [Ignavibacteria bacterium]